MTSNFEDHAEEKGNRMREMPENMNSTVWFEAPVVDVDRAWKFYEMKTKNKKSDHEKKVCIAITLSISSHKGIEFSKMSCPDEQERNDEAVDLKACVKNSQVVYFLEHTRIESFSGQIGKDVAFNDCRFPRAVPTDLEDKRRERIRRALNDKCPKLASAKNANEDSLSVLVLESNDIALANYPAIATVAISELLKRNDIPDEVYLAETEIEPWVIWTLKDGSRIFPNISEEGSGWGSYRAPFIKSNK